MDSLFIASFVAGVLTILAPCVLPVLPIILAGSLSERKWWYPYVVIGSLAISLIIFTVLLKVSTLFIEVPSGFWKYLSGGILVALGCMYLFPHVWSWIGERLRFGSANASLDRAQDIRNPLVRAIVTGGALGPVFSTCSPTYTLLLATVFPVSLIDGVFYAFVYVAGFSLMLGVIAILGRTIILKLRIIADERGWFKKILGCIFVLIGFLIMSGLDKDIETTILKKFDIGQLETQLFPFILSSKNTMNTSTTSLLSLKKAYFAGGCFWCMEGIFEAQDGVLEAISGYAEGSKEDATYEKVSLGITKHREAVEVTYDPAKISFATLVDLYYTQIDPTQTDGQFADKGFRYTTATYYTTDEEKSLLEQARNTLEKSGRFDAPIAVKIVPFTTFFPAEEFHQDYYKKSAFRYNLYKEGSGRKKFIEENGHVGATIDAGKNSQYFDYDTTKIASLTGSRIFLFFHASWCSTCQNFEKQILAGGLPSDVVIFKVDYDTATDLKKKYAVLSQSTWVQIDASGNMYKRWLGKTQLKEILDESILPKDILLQKLTPLQYEVTQMGGTEKPFDNAYWDNHEAGIYVDIVDGTPLFSSLDKFDSGTGWPSFTRPISESLVASHEDERYGMIRTEIKSNKAGSHLGHVFDDGPAEKGGKRYCINSAALRFIPVSHLEAEGYGAWLKLFENIK